METPKDHIARIRKETFSIGEKSNPLAPMLDQAVKYLSAELYSKDVHFLMELIQNAEDNEYLEGVDPSLEFVITSRDITATGAPATLLMFNNEKGFSPKNIESICNVGNSTKKGHRKRGYIGEKGIGFKSVFLITSQPFIFSNGYQIRFNEKPCPHCNLGYIVPEWVEENPSVSDIKRIYGSGSSLPTTVMVLPLKFDKVKPVKQQLSSIHPEVLLFLSKIKRLSIREDNEDSNLNSVSAIAITKETNFKTRKNIDAESFTLHLSADEDSVEYEKECSYYMWRQKFPVKQANRVERRMDVDDWLITLAFPNGQRLHRGRNSPGIYSFLPTEMVTNFPFIIQADFILSSSRESVLLDNIWNQGILECVPSAFVNALTSLVKMTDAPVSSLPRMFLFLPLNSSPYPQLNEVRESIKKKLAEEEIVPSESHSRDQKFFHKPSEVGRIMAEFWDILNVARDQGVRLLHLSSHGWYVLNAAFDLPEYDNVLNFLGVGLVNNEWYVKCIQSSNLLTRVSENVYLRLLLFIADNWYSKFQGTKMQNIPLIKHVEHDGSVSLCSVTESSRTGGAKVLCRSYVHRQTSWLIEWNKEFRTVANFFFLPKSTQEALNSFPKREALLQWLRNCGKLSDLNVHGYAVAIRAHLDSSRRLSLVYAHFLYHSFSNEYLSSNEINSLCANMPFVDSYGFVKVKTNGILVPANGSKWVELIGSNPWQEEAYIELAEDYMRRGEFAGTSTKEGQLIEFLRTRVAASDIPSISPPNAGIPTASAPLTKKNAFLLLDWIRELRYKKTLIPQKFLTCIKNGSWMKVTINGSPSYMPPSESFLFPSNNRNSKWGNVLQNGYALADIPVIDERFYGPAIIDYKEELKIIGVMFEYGEACSFIGKHLLSLAASSTLTRSNMISLLKFITLLKQNFLSPDEFISTIKGGRWLRTSCGNRSPVGTVLYDEGWAVARQISKIPFIDQEYYGDEIFKFKPELELLGVIVGFRGNYQFVLEHLKPPPFISSLTAAELHFILNCVRYSASSEKLVRALERVKCLKTNSGYKCPGECFLFDPEWGCLLEVFSGFPLIDHDFYGSPVRSHKAELKQLGVKLDFLEAVKVFELTFKQKASKQSITKENVLSFLSCRRKLKGTVHKFPASLKKCIREEKWLHTRLGDYRSPRHCILFGPEWESISAITRLPFINDDDQFYGNSIYKYQKELKGMGVVVELKDGVKFVADGLSFPSDPSCITPAQVFSLLECIKILLQDKDYSFPLTFQKSHYRGWLRTHDGYNTPDKSCLFDRKWTSLLKPTDGPFIDEEFYGSKIASYGEELCVTGVVIDDEKTCSLLAAHMFFLSESDSILRILTFLSQQKWLPDRDASRKIWIPDGHGSGKWVNPEQCVLHDREGHFGLLLNVLENYYDESLLLYLSGAYRVKPNASLEDYCEIWKIWESSGSQLSHSQCCAFWECVLTHWNSETEKMLAERLAKVPVVSGSGDILLVEKSDAFIADDLLLKEIFKKFSSRPLFVWYPQPSLPSLPRTKLLDIYGRIGVRRISESAKKEELSLAADGKLEKVNPKEHFVRKGLFRLILGYLADPSIDMDVKERHRAVQSLLDLNLLKIAEPITAIYSLQLSSGEVLNPEARQMIRWDKNSSKFYTQKLDKSGGRRTLIEYATFFSEIIAKGVLWDKEDHVTALTELIKFAVLLDFSDGAIQFLMNSKNLQIFVEDEEFLSAAFPSE